jgi:hypothetical protein
MSDLSVAILKGDLLSAAVHQVRAAQALHLGEGRVDAVAQAYSVPLVVALPQAHEGFVVLPTRDAIESFFRHKHATLRRADMPMPQLNVSQVRQSAPGRVTVEAEWVYVTRDGRSAGISKIRNFLECRDGTFSIQMVEFENVTYPQIIDWFENEFSPGQPQRRVLH